jgi:hypothetical protein
LTILTQQAAPPAPPPAQPATALSAAQTAAVLDAIEPDIASLLRKLRVHTAADGSLLSDGTAVDRTQLRAVVAQMGCLSLLRRSVRNRLQDLVFAAARPGELPNQRVHPAGVLLEVHGVRSVAVSALAAVRADKVAAAAEPLASPGALAASPEVALAREVFLAAKCGVDARAGIVRVLAAAGSADAAVSLLQQSLTLGESTGAAADKLPIWLEVLRALLPARLPWSPEPCDVLRAYAELLLADGLDAPGTRVQQLRAVAALLLRGGAPSRNSVSQLAAKSARRWQENDAAGAVLRGDAGALITSMVWQPLMAGQRLPSLAYLKQRMAPGFVAYALGADKANFGGVLEGLCAALAPDRAASREPSGDARLMDCVKRAKQHHAVYMYTTGTPSQWSTASQSQCTRQRACAAGMLTLTGVAPEKVVEYYAICGASGDVLHGSTAQAVAAEWRDDDDEGGGGPVTAEGILGACFANDMLVKGWHPDAAAGSMLPSRPFSDLLAHSARTGLAPKRPARCRRCKARKRHLSTQGPANAGCSPWTELFTCCSLLAFNATMVRTLPARMCCPGTAVQQAGSAASRPALSKHAFRQKLVKTCFCRAFWTFMQHLHACVIPFRPAPRACCPRAFAHYALRAPMLLRKRSALDWRHNPARRAMQRRRHPHMSRATARKF